MNQTKQTLYMSEVKYREVNTTCLNVPVDTPFEASSFFFFFPCKQILMSLSHGMFSDNKSVLEMSMCQNETAGSQLIFRLVIPKACSDTEKKVSVLSKLSRATKFVQKMTTPESLETKVDFKCHDSICNLNCTEPYLLVLTFLCR